jgi:hypothetical protein
MRLMEKPSGSVSDLKAIEALNERDKNAVMACDVASITAQWTAGFVAISAGGPIIRGRAANVEIAELGKAQIDSMEPWTTVSILRKSRFVEVTRMRGVRTGAQPACGRADRLSSTAAS